MNPLTPNNSQLSLTLDLSDIDSLVDLDRISGITGLEHDPVLQQQPQRPRSVSDADQRQHQPTAYIEGVEPSDNDIVLNVGKLSKIHTGQNKYLSAYLKHKSDDFIFNHQFKNSPVQTRRQIIAKMIMDFCEITGAHIYWHDRKFGFRDATAEEAIDSTMRKYDRLEKWG